MWVCKWALLDAALELAAVASVVARDVRVLAVGAVPFATLWSREPKLPRALLPSPPMPRAPAVPSARVPAVL
jgi:hypothetical protein